MPLSRYWPLWTTALFLLALSLAGQALASPSPWHHATIRGSGGVPLNVVTAGDRDAPAIVFIHGIGQSHYSFVRQLNSELADAFYLVTFDLRGHGASGKPWQPEDYGPGRVWAEDLAAVLQQTGASKPLVVAWSYGTFVLLDYLREFGPAHLSGVVLSGGLGGLLPFRMPKDDPNAAEFLKLRTLRESPDLLDHIRANQGMTRWLTAEPLPETEQRLFQAFGLMLPPYARQAMMQRDLNNQDLLEQLKLPVWLALGAEDNPLLLEDGATLAVRGNVQLSIFTDAGHSVFYERPEDFNRQLAQFAREAFSSPEPAP